MLPGFFLSLREGFEAALILGIVLGALHKINRRELKFSVWGGAAVAGLISVITAILVYSLGSEFEGIGEAIFEGILMLSAAALLTWMIFWMRRQSGAYASELESGVKDAAVSIGSRGLFLLAFLAVGREGLELAFFLTVSAFSAGAWLTIMGAILGLIVAAILGFLLFSSTRRLSIRNFFLVTNILLILLAAGLVARGIHELNEARLVPALKEHVWNTNSFLNEESTLGSIFVALLGYNGDPSLTELVAYFGYFLLVGFIFYSFSTPAGKKTHRIESRQT